MFDIGLLGAVGNAANNFADSYSQARKDKRAQQLQDQQLKLAQIGEAAKVIDLTGDLPKGLLSPDVESVFKPNEANNQQGLLPGQPNQTQQPQAQGLLPQQSGQSAQPVAPDQQVKPKQTQYPQMSGGQSPPLTNPGYLTRPQETQFYPKHVRDGMQKAFQYTLEIQKTRPGEVVQYNPDARSFETRSVPLTPQQQLERQKLQSEISASGARSFNQRTMPQQREESKYESSPSYHAVQSSLQDFNKIQQILHGPDPYSPDAQKEIPVLLARLSKPGQAPDVTSIEEFRNIPGLQGTADAMQQLVTSSYGQNRLDDIERAAVGMFKGVYEGNKPILNQFARNAQKKGLDPSFVNNPEFDQMYKDATKRQKELGSYKPASGTDVVSPFLQAIGLKPKLGTAEAKEQSPKNSNGPKAGTIEDGHKFLGGDPSNPKNWQRVK